MGNAFYRQNELDLSSALAEGIPMLTSMFGTLGESSGDLLPRLRQLLEQMDPELIETLSSQLSTTIFGRSE